ncbi:MAG TPA: hypothetical protein VFX61_05920 [Micromonosporaceae bacterium]|nr:hypothetical protein [Micromonosporaceae bacterium]
MAVKASRLIHRSVIGKRDGRWEPIVFEGCAIDGVIWILAMVGIGMWTISH